MGYRPETVYDNKPASRDVNWTIGLYVLQQTVEHMGSTVEVQQNK